MLWPRDTPQNRNYYILGFNGSKIRITPRGYRELRSPAEMRKLLNRKIRQQGGICAICREEFTDYNDIAPDHRNPKGMGGSWRDVVESVNYVRASKL